MVHVSYNANGSIVPLYHECFQSTEKDDFLMMQGRRGGSEMTKAIKLLAIITIQ